MASAATYYKRIGDKVIQNRAACPTTVALADQLSDEGFDQASHEVDGWANSGFEIGATVAGLLVKSVRAQAAAK